VKDNQQRGQLVKGKRLIVKEPRAVANRKSPSWV
jgi:hypothetical protein